MTLPSSITTSPHGLMAGLQPSSELSRAAALSSACISAGAAMAPVTFGAPCWRGSAGESGSTVAASSCRGGSARPAAARWTELHLVSQHAPHAAHQQLPQPSTADLVNAADPHQQQQQEQPDRQRQKQQQDFEFPQRKPPTMAGAPHPQPQTLPYGRRSFDTAVYSSQQQLRARAVGSTTCGAYPAAAATGGAFPDYAAALEARHTFAHGAGRREGAGDREWGQGHSQQLRGGTSCQLPEAVAALLRQLMDLEAPAAGAAAAGAGGGGRGNVSNGSFAASDAGGGLSRGGPAAASTGNCSCGTDISAETTSTTTPTTTSSSRANSVMVGVCSGVLGSCASGSSGVLNTVEALYRGSATRSSGTGSAAADSHPQDAPPACPVCARAAGDVPTATTATTTTASTTTGMSAVATCPTSHAYRLFGRAGDQVLHLRLPGASPAVLAAAAALSAESWRWVQARLPLGAEAALPAAAAAAAASGFAHQQQEQGLQRRRQPALLVATTLADGCEEEGGGGGGAGMDAAVMSFTAATLAMDAPETAPVAAMPPWAPPPLTLTLARPPLAAFPLNASEEAGPGPSVGVDVTAFHVYASDDGLQVLLLLVVERPLLMPMRVSPRRLEQPRSATLPVRPGAAAVVAGTATRSWGRLRRQVVPAVLRPSDAGMTTGSGSSSFASLEAVGASAAAPGGAAGMRHPLPLPQPPPLPLPPASHVGPVPPRGRVPLNSGSCTVWVEDGVQRVPAAAAAVALVAADQFSVGAPAASWGADLLAPRTGALARFEAGAEVGEPPATPIVGAPRRHMPDSAEKDDIRAAPACSGLQSVAADIQLSRPAPGTHGSWQPPAPDCEAHVLMTLTAPNYPVRTSDVAAAASMKPSEQQAKELQQERVEPTEGSPGGPNAGRGMHSSSGHQHRADSSRSAAVAGAAVTPAGVAATAAGRPTHNGSDGAGATGPVAAAVAVIPWAAFVSGDVASSAAPYLQAVPPSPFSPHRSTSSSSSYSTTSRGSAASAIASASAAVASPFFLRSFSSTSPPASAAQLRRRHRQKHRPRERAPEQEGGEGEGDGELRTLYPTLFPPSMSPSAMPSGAFTSEELFMLSMPSHASGALASFSGQGRFNNSSSGGGDGAARFSAAAPATAADAAVAAAAETTAGWLLAGQPVSFPYAASPSSPSSSASSSTSSSSPSSPPSSSGSSSDRYEPECGDAAQAAGRRAAAAASAAAGSAVPPQSRQPVNGEGARRTGAPDGHRPATELAVGARAIPGAGMGSRAAARNSHPDGGLLAAATPISPAAGVGLAGMSADSGGVGLLVSPASRRAAVNAADAARMARVRAGWRVREAEWSEREAAWRVTESRWWQQAGGGGLWG